MVRKGQRKVHTGCKTCKVRKVKCDEGKPFCNRCTSTGRKCDGYEVRLPKSERKEQPLRAKIPIIISPCPQTVDEGRAMEFFRSVVAPVLPANVEGTFWTYLVPQLGYNERCIQHAILSVSSLYENFITKSQQNEHIADETRYHFAIKHYNAAIREVASARDETVILFNCILFSAAEFLRGDFMATSYHSGHGVNILNNTTRLSSLAQEQLLPLFHRMSVVLFLFGGSGPLPSFPYLQPKGNDHCGSFESLAQAQRALDPIIARGVRFLYVAQQGDATRKPGSEDEGFEKLQQDQAGICTSLGEWFEAFATFVREHTQGSYNESLRAETHMKYLVANIWMKTALVPGENALDSERVTFSAIVDLAKTITAQYPWANDCQRVMFISDVAYLPLVFFVAVKCRWLDIRLAAWSIIKELTKLTNTHFDVPRIEATARRIIEEEHGVDLTDGAVIRRGDYALPPKTSRKPDLVVDSSMDAYDETCGVEDLSAKDRISFLVRCGSYELGVLADWIALGKSSKTSTRSVPSP